MIKLFSPDLLQLLVTFGLVILIWIIQILHYPSFVFYGEKDFPQAMRLHQRGITFIAAPLMISELVLAVLIFYQSQDFYSSISLLLVGLIWLSTFLIQVPLHEKLLRGKEVILIERLVRTNWIRTFLWSLKMLVLSWHSYL